MDDLAIARNELYEEQLTLVIVKNGEVFFETKNHRISGFMQAIEQFGDKLEGASIADRVAGKAVALLCAYSKVKAVYATVLSRKAHSVFRRNGIRVQWKELVDNVLDADKTGVCPFEKAAENISKADEAYILFKSLLDNMKACK